MNIQHHGRKIGVYKKESKTFVTWRTTKYHYFIKYSGYAMSNTVLSKLKNLGCQTIIIIEQRNDSTKRKLTTPLLKYYEHGAYHTDNNADHQRVLSLDHFKKDEDQT